VRPFDSVWLVGVDFSRYLLQNMDWLEEELGGFEDDYLIFDCPGVFASSIPSLIIRHN
jgi:hypothetical protein